MYTLKADCKLELLCNLRDATAFLLFMQNQESNYTWFRTWREQR